MPVVGRAGPARSSNAYLRLLATDYVCLISSSRDRGVFRGHSPLNSRLSSEQCRRHKSPSDCPLTLPMAYRTDELLSNVVYGGSGGVGFVFLFHLAVGSDSVAEFHARDHVLQVV